MDNLALQQHALITVKLLSISIAREHPMEFTTILEKISITLKNSDDIPVYIVAQLVLCLAEICANLKAHSISYISIFMPALGKILEKQITNVTAVLSPILTAFYKLFETLPLFLSPYLVKTIVNLSQISAKMSTNCKENQIITSKLDAICKKMALVLPLRLLVPSVDHSYKYLIDEMEYTAIGPLMQLLLDSFKHVNGSDIAPHQTDLSAFFIHALQLRSNNKEIDEHIISTQEDHIINAFIGLVLKLSESSFRPLYYKVHDWAIKDNSSFDRAITFFR